MNRWEAILNRRMINVCLLLATLLIGAWSETAHGDGGTVRLSRSEGNYQVTVFTDPTPFRAGLVDISVLIQDAATREPIPDARVTVILTPRDRSSGSLQHTATTAAATNKLLKAAVFELPAPGLWDAEVIVAGKHGEAQVRFELAASARIPELPTLWLWIAWPIPVILLFVVHQLLVGRKIRKVVVINKSKM